MISLVFTGLLVGGEFGCGAICRLSKKDIHIFIQSYFTLLGIKSYQRKFKKTVLTINYFFIAEVTEHRSDTKYQGYPADPFCDNFSMQRNNGNANRRYTKHLL
ncbi:hypothetical protein [Legionella nagasakiensis]|uniref:hypothetical protein n=1 Tax=Legionella nagasakiensis TaxID=535290 RepID=UPI0010549C1F|nr:hypothetical protein [Legionella nagasakiensis]